MEKAQIINDCISVRHELLRLNAIPKHVIYTILEQHNKTCHTLTIEGLRGLLRRDLIRIQEHPNRIRKIFTVQATLAARCLNQSDNFKYLPNELKTMILGYTASKQLYQYESQENINRQAFRILNNTLNFKLLNH